MKSNGVHGVVAITGASSGLGYEQSRYMYDLGYHVIMICRTREGADKAIKTITDSVGVEGTRRISVVLLDLTDLNSVKEAVQNFEYPVTSLVLNADLSYPGPHQYTTAGYEKTFAISHLGHYYLTTLLLQKHAKTLDRIVVMSSDAHDPEVGTNQFPAPSFESIEDIARPQNKPSEDYKSAGKLRYVHSNLCNILFGYELDRRLKQLCRNEVFINILNPGIVPHTNLSRNESALKRVVTKKVLPIFGIVNKSIRTPQQVAVMVHNLIEKVDSSGGYYDQGEKVDSSKLSYDTKLATDLWELSSEATGVTLP